MQPQTGAAWGRPEAPLFDPLFHGYALVVKPPLDDRLEFCLHQPLYLGGCNFIEAAHHFLIDLLCDASLPRPHQILLLCRHFKLALPQSFMPDLEAPSKFHDVFFPQG